MGAFDVGRLFYTSLKEAWLAAAELAAGGPHNGMVLADATLKNYGVASNGGTEVVQELVPGTYLVWLTGRSAAVDVLYRLTDAATAETINALNTGGAGQVNTPAFSGSERVTVVVPPDKTFFHFKLTGAGTTLLNFHRIA